MNGNLNLLKIKENAKDIKGFTYRIHFSLV